MTLALGLVVPLARCVLDVIAITIDIGFLAQPLILGRVDAYTLKMGGLVNGICWIAVEMLTVTMAAMPSAERAVLIV